MKTFSTLSAIVALLWSTSAAASRVVIMPEDIDRCVAEAKHERQSQCGGFQPGSLEYNKCMAHWTDRVIQCYPRDAPLSPRQVADRNAEEARGTDFHNEVSRLQDMPLVRHRDEDYMMERARPIDRMMVDPQQPPMPQPQRPQAMPMEHNNNMQRQPPSPPQNQRQNAPHPPPFMQQQQPARNPPPPPAAAIIKDKPQQIVNVQVPVMTKPATGKQEPIKPSLPLASQNPTTVEEDSDIDEVPAPQAPAVQAKANNNDMTPVTVTTTVNGAPPAPAVVKSVAAAAAAAAAPVSAATTVSPIDTVIVQEETTQMVLQAPPPAASAAPPAASAAPPVAAKPQTTTPVAAKPPVPPQTTSASQSSDIPTPLSPEQMGVLQASIANNHANALKEASMAVTAALSSAAQSANNLSASARAAIAPTEAAAEDAANADDDEPIVVETTTTTVVVPAVATAPLAAVPNAARASVPAAAAAPVDNEMNVTAVATATATVVLDKEGVSVGPVDNIIPENNIAVPSLAGIVGGTQVPQVQEQSPVQPDSASTSFAQVRLTTIGNAVVPVDTNIFSAREEIETNSPAVATAAVSTPGVVSDDSDNESESVSSPAAAPAPVLSSSSSAANASSNSTSAAIGSSSTLADSTPPSSASSSATGAAALKSAAVPNESTSATLLNTSPILVDVASSASAQSNSAIASEDTATVASASSSNPPGKIALGKNTYLPVAKALGISKKPASTSSLHSAESTSDTARLGMMKNKMADSAAAPNAHTASVSGVAVAMLVGLVVANGNSLF